MAAGHTRRRWGWLGPLSSAVIFIASIAVLWVILQEIEPGELAAALRRTASETLLVGCGFTALSYLLLTGYDALALRRLGLAIPYRTTALAAYTSFSVSFTLGFPLVTAATVRFWIYAARGVRATEVAKLTVIVGLTFWLGMLTVAGFTALWVPAEIALLARTAPLVVQAVGGGLLALIAGYLVWVSGGRRAVELRGWRLELPGFWLTFAQILLGAGELCAAAAVLYVLLPAGHGVPYEAFLAVYVFACIVGIASHLPGGVGAFEATMLLGLSMLPREPLLGALLLFRIIYYLIPFVLALALLGLYEVAKRIRARSL